MMEIGQQLKQLTILSQIGLRLSSSLDPETVIRASLESVTQTLRYDRAMISFFNASQNIVSQVWIMDVSDKLAEIAHSRKIFVTDPESIEGTVLLKGMPVLIEKIHSVHAQLHPLIQQFVSTFHVQGFIAVPMKINNRIIGSMVADHSTSSPISQDDVTLLMTVGAHIALALENAAEYQYIAQCNVTLKEKVREQTHALEQLTSDLATTNTQLHELNKEKSQILSHCSHELRTPLTAIKGFAENLLQGLCGPLTDKQHLYLGRVNANADRLTRMIEDLLDLSRIEGEKFHLILSEIRIFQLTTDVIGQFLPLAQAKQQRLEMHCPNATLLMIADAKRITQILTNVIHNAIKFTPAHGSIDVKVFPGPHDTISIIISDTGSGISEKKIPRLFDPFFQGHREPEIGIKGLGLGLSIVKILVDRHGGSIHIESQTHKGTSVYISLPTKAASRDPVQDSTALLRLRGIGIHEKHQG